MRQWAEERSSGRQWHYRHVSGLRTLSGNTGMLVTNAIARGRDAAPSKSLRAVLPRATSSSRFERKGYRQALSKPFLKNREKEG
jgi:hypothetical protein